MDIYYISALATGSMSIIVSISTLIYFTINPKIRTSIDGSYYYLVIQSIDLCLCIVSLINPVPTKNNFCKIQAYLEQTLGLTLVLWDCIISLSLVYDFLVKKGEKSFPKKISLIAIITLSSLISSIPFFYNSYGINTPFCSILIKRYPYMIFELFYIPFIVSCIFSGICLYFIHKFMRTRCSENSCRTYINVLRAFPISLCLSYGCLFISRVMQDVDLKSEAFFAFSFALSLSHGMFNGLIIVYSVRSYKKMQDILYGKVSLGNNNHALIKLVNQSIDI